MKTELKIKELEKSRRLSARAIPFQTGLLVFAGMAVWLAGKFFAVSCGLKLIVLGVIGGVLLGDVFSYVHCSRRLKRLKRG